MLKLQTKIGGITPESVVALLAVDTAYRHYARDCYIVGLSPDGNTVQVSTEWLTTMELGHIATELNRMLNELHEFKIEYDEPLKRLNITFTGT